MKKVILILAMCLLWCNIAIAIDVKVPIKYRELPIDPYNKKNEAWNKGEEGNVYHQWRKDYKKMMDEFYSEVHVFCWDNAPKNRGGITVVKFVECEREEVSRHVKKHNLYTYETMEAISEYQRKQKAILAPIVYSLKWSEKLAKEWLDKREKITLKLYRDLYNAVKKGALSEDKSYYAKKKKKKKEEGPKINDNEILPASSGTGFFVSKEGHIVTNHHVISDCKPVKVLFEGKDYEAKVLAIDKMNDLAILKTDLIPKSIYTVSKEDPQMTETVFVAGYPLGKSVSSSIKASKGIVTALAGLGDNFAEFQIDAALNSGNSGGPIINEQGNVIGVAVSKIKEAEGFNFGVKVSILKIFANSNELNLPEPLEGTKRSKKKVKKLIGNKERGDLMTKATLYIECWMTGKQIKRLIAKKNSVKAFYSKYKK